MILGGLVGFRTLVEIVDSSSLVTNRRRGEVWHGQMEPFVGSDKTSRARRKEADWASGLPRSCPVLKFCGECPRSCREQAAAVARAEFALFSYSPPGCTGRLVMALTRLPCGSCAHGGEVLCGPTNRVCGLVLSEVLMFVARRRTCPPLGWGELVIAALRARPPV